MMNNKELPGGIDEKGGWMPVQDHTARIFAENVTRMMMASGYTVDLATRELHLAGRVGRDCASFSVSEGWLCVTNSHFPEHGDSLEWTFSFRELAAAVAKMEEISPARGLSAQNAGSHELGGWLPGCERTARVYAESMVRGLLATGEYSTEQAEASVGFGRSLGGKDGGYAILQGQVTVANGNYPAGPESWEFPFRELAETVGQFETRTLRDYYVKDGTASEPVRAVSIATAVELYCSAYKPERTAKARSWPIFIHAADDRLLAEYEVRQSPRGRISTHEVATQPDAELWAAQPGRAICRVDVWGKTYSLEADFHNPASPVVFNGIATGFCVEEYDVVLGGLGGGVTLAEAMMHHHLREIGNRQFPTTVWLSGPDGEREITVPEMTGEHVEELKFALADMRAEPAITAAVGTPQNPIYTGLNTEDGFEVMDAGATLIVGCNRLHVAKQFRGRQFEAAEIVQIYEATERVAQTTPGVPLSRSKLPEFDLRSVVSGQMVRKRVSVDLLEGTLHALPVLESQEEAESSTEAKPRGRGR